ncbi:metal-dependent hydrolase [Thermoflavimicrobium daqui]|jgi:L-ascorbate metabolism protein UlaG (beta-lactamase superfamily)|uniref:UPF0173 metal-dependent hydrolase DL897_02035 n=1 Tax=Thermoflavimicrobium daqui TaxID=2137476 RepID=A0A364K984_9BACL|nr:metal-dependent hydrolase [Thermoflavimicrobium daqui]RAL26851.1 metal-dependent hydrolase [Thermoflavimicrobium daqui]
MKITFLGHSGVLIEHDSYCLVIDPFITGNPVAKVAWEDLKADYILVTHGHGDHLGDTIEIAKKNKATVIANFELATYLDWQGVKTHGMHIGGSFTFDFGTVKLTPAFHGTGLVVEHGKKKEIIYLGMPAGLLLTLGDKTIYHAGDTGLFSDMKLIGRNKPVDLAFLPIGDNFTMGPEDALLAAEWVQAKQVVPIHFNTFPLLQQDPHHFAKSLEQKGIQGTVLDVGGQMIL